MIRFATMIGLCMLCACQHQRSVSAADALEDATFVLPGTFSKQTTVANLQGRFGTANVKVTSVPNAYGDSRRGVVLFPDDPTRRARYSTPARTTKTVDGGQYHSADPSGARARGATDGDARKDARRVPSRQRAAVAGAKGSRLDLRHP